MPTITDDLRKTATDTGYAVVALTDLAVRRVRSAQARAVEARDGLDPDTARSRVEAELKKAQTTVVQLPGTAVSSVLEVAGRAEEGFDDLAGRGREVVTRIRRQKATQDLVQQGRTTLSRTKAAVTTVRRGADDTTSAAKGAAATARHEATRTTATTSATKRAATTGRKRAAASKSATKSAATSARKTASAAKKATSAAADKAGS